MTLEQFVKETLEAVLNGVAQAQSGYLGTRIVPQAIDSQNRREGVVKFDVAVTVEGGRNIEGGGTTKILSVVDVGGKWIKTKREQTSNRVQFEVPVLYMAT